MAPKKKPGEGDPPGPAKRTRRSQQPGQSVDDGDENVEDLPLIKEKSPTKPKYWKRNFDPSYSEY